MASHNIRLDGETLKNCPRCGQDYNQVTCGHYSTDAPGNDPAAMVRRELSFRERQVVKLVRQAKANKEIAYELHLAEGTIKEYLFTIFKKLGVKNRTELALWAAENLPA